MRLVPEARLGALLGALLGTAELYDWMDRNPSIRMLRTE